MFLFRFRGHMVRVFHIEILLFVLFFALGFYTINNPHNVIDDRLFHFVSSFQHEKVTKIMLFLEHLGNKDYIVAMLAVIGVFLIPLKRAVEYSFLVFSVGGAFVLNFLLKHFFHRPRPSWHIIVKDGFSFPSRHCMVSVALYGFFCFLLWTILRHQWFSYKSLIIFVTFLILAIGFSMVYLGAHYPTDVIGGLMISCLWLSICIRLYFWLTMRN